MAVDCYHCLLLMALLLRRFLFPPQSGFGFTIVGKRNLVLSPPSPPPPLDASARTHSQLQLTGQLWRNFVFTFVRLYSRCTRLEVVVVFGVEECSIHLSFFLSLVAFSFFFFSDVLL